MLYFCLFIDPAKYVFALTPMITEQPAKYDTGKT